MTGFYMKSNTGLKWVKDSSREKLLSIKTDVKLNFNDQIKHRRKKPVSKLKALSRTTYACFS